MIYQVTTTSQADADLRGIYEHIAFELLSPDHAARQLERLEDQCGHCDCNPCHVCWQGCRRPA